LHYWYPASALAAWTPGAAAYPAECPETDPLDVDSNTTLQGNNLLPFIGFISIVFGVLVTYWFLALTARSVCAAIDTMVLEILRRFFESKGNPLWKNRLSPVASKIPR
jgi:Na+/H+-translocating membrane pyrophosphatase